MSSATNRTARLARYTTAGAIAPVAAIGSLAQADVYSGSFTDLTLAASGGSISIGSGFLFTFSGSAGEGMATGGSTVDLALGTQIGAPSLGFAAVHASSTNGSSWLVGLAVLGDSQTQFLTDKQLASAGQTFNELAKTGSNAGTSAWSNVVHFGSRSGSKIQTPSDTFYTMFVSHPGDVDEKYGWISFSWSFTDRNDWTLSIDEWAWSDDGPLAAGATGGATPVPGLGGLAALALGAAGVRGRRHRVA